LLAKILIIEIEKEIQVRKKKGPLPALQKERGCETNLSLVRSACSPNVTPIGRGEKRVSLEFEKREKAEIRHIRSSRSEEKKQRRKNLCMCPCFRRRGERPTPECFVVAAPKKKMKKNRIGEKGGGINTGNIKVRKCMLFGGGGGGVLR